MPERFEAGDNATAGLSPAEPQGIFRADWAKSVSLYQYRPITAVQAQTPRCSSQGDVELVTEKKVLGFKPAPRREHVGDENYERLPLIRYVPRIKIRTRKPSADH
jgi:hypothetical protein